MPGPYDLTGQRFGRWLVLHRVPGYTASGKIRWMCRCNCGRKVPVLAFSLRSGDSTQCKSCAWGTTRRKRWKDRR